MASAREALHMYRECFGTHYDNYPTALTIAGLSLNRLGRPVEAEKLLRDAVKLRLESLPPGHFFAALAQGALGEFLLDRGRFAEAETFLVQSYNDLLLSGGSENPRTSLAKHRLRDLYLAMKRPKEVVKFQP